MKFSDINKNFQSVKKETILSQQKDTGNNDLSQQKNAEEKTLAPDPELAAGPIAADNAVKQTTTVPTANVNPVESLTPASSVSNLYEDNIRFSIKKEKPLSVVSFKNREKELIEKAKAVYGRALYVSKETFSALNRPYTEKYFEIEYIVRSLRSEMKENPFLQSMLPYLTTSNCLYSHSVNVSIIAMGAAEALNMPEEELLHMGVAAFLHDVGMADYESFCRLERQINKRERKLVQGHLVAGLEKLDRIVDLDGAAKEFVLEVMGRHHERLDGSGYPNGLFGDAIGVQASILGVADVYEAMTHKMSWREAFDPDVVIKYFMGDMMRLFDPRSLKGVIDFLSIYPVGSLVRLTTGEIAVVIAVNRRSFSRPVVKILMDDEFKPVQASYVNLMDYPLTSIDSVVSMAEFAKANPDFHADFSFDNLWIEWEEEK